MMPTLNHMININIEEESKLQQQSEFLMSEDENIPHAKVTKAHESDDIVTIGQLLSKAVKN